MSTKENQQNQTLSFEKAMEELEEIVDLLEEGQVPLEEAINLFQKGMNLSKVCHDTLQRVEKQVLLLIEENGELVKKDLQIEEDTRD